MELTKEKILADKMSGLSEEKLDAINNLKEEYNKYLDEVVK